MPIYYDSLDLSAKEKQIFLLGALAAGMITGLLFYDSVPAGIFLTACFSLLFPKYRKAVRERKKGQLLVQFRDLLYSVASSVSTGRTMTQALEESIEFWKSTYEENDYIMRELRYMTACIKNGNRRDTEVLRDFAERSGLEDTADFVSVYESLKLTGGDLPKAINRAAAIIGDKITLERELKTLMAQKVFESRIVALAPFAIVLFLKVMSPEYLKPMTGTRQGIFITTFALTLIGLSLLLMERINKIEI